MATTLTPITATIPDFTVTPAINTATFPEDIDQYNSELPAVIAAQDLLGSQINTLIPQLNTLEDNVSGLEASTQASADIAIAIANFQGTWTNQLTSIPQSWLYNGVVYMVLVPGTASPATTPSNWFAVGTASSTTFTPTGGISATTVQAAIEELDTEKAPIASPTFTGVVTAPTLNVTTINASTSIIFEGATPDAFETVLSVVEPTSDNTLLLPNKNGTLATTDDITAATGTIVTGVRQTVQKGLKDANGRADFIKIGALLSIDIDTQTVALVCNAAGGDVALDRRGVIPISGTLLNHSGLTPSATNYLFLDVAADGTCTVASSVQAHVEQFYGTPSTTTGVLTFNYGEMTGYTGVGGTAPQSWRIAIGEAVTNGTNVTSVVTYALNGVYDSGYTNTLPGSGGQIVKNHNIGTHPKYQRMVIKCLTAEFGYAIGDIVYGVFTYGTYASGMPFIITPKSLTFRATNVGSPMGLLRADTGGLVNLTGANWAYKFEAERGW